MDRSSRPQQAKSQRQQQVARIVSRLRRAIQDEPLLVRLPSERELGRLLGASVRQVHSALAGLVAEGLLRPLGRHGYRVAKRPSARSALPHTVIFAGPIPSGLINFTQYVVLGAEAECRRLGLKFRYQHVPSQQWHERVAATVADEPAAGIGWLIGGEPVPEEAANWLAQGRRFVLVDYLSTQVQLPAVLLNQAAAAELAVAHLHSLGHRKAALIYMASSPLIPFLLRHLRERDMLAAATEWNLSLTDADSLSTLLGRWANQWKRGPTRPAAVIVHNLTIALLLLDLCRTAGIDVPRQLSLLTVGSNYGRGSLPVTLASAGNAEDLGRLAVRTLLRPDVMEARPVVTAEATLEMANLTTRRIGARHR